MCSVKSEKEKIQDLENYYSAAFASLTENDFVPRYYETAFDHLQTPIITAGKPNNLQLFHWGLIPYWTKSLPDALKLRTLTVNCKTEEMFDKPAFRDALKNNQRCLIPCTGFFEWQHRDNGKKKIPHFIRLREPKLFSLAGIYSRWRNPDTDQFTFTYSILTTSANKLMGEIHNSKKRMPVIIPRDHEKDWLNPKLSKDDVMSFCQPFNDSAMTAHTVGKLISTKDTDKNVPAVIEPFTYPEELRLFS